jgi:hypothetical protein
MYDERRSENTEVGRKLDVYMMQCHRTVAALA